MFDKNSHFVSTHQLWLKPFFLEARRDANSWGMVSESQTSVSGVNSSDGPRQMSVNKPHHPRLTLCLPHSPGHNVRLFLLLHPPPSLPFFLLLFCLFICARVLQYFFFVLYLRANLPVGLFWNLSCEEKKVNPLLPRVLFLADIP